MSSVGCFFATNSRIILNKSAQSAESVRELFRNQLKTNQRKPFLNLCHPWAVFRHESRIILNKSAQSAESVRELFRNQLKTNQLRPV